MLRYYISYFVYQKIHAHRYQAIYCICTESWNSGDQSVINNHHAKLHHSRTITAQSISLKFSSQGAENVLVPSGEYLS